MREDQADRIADAIEHQNTIQKEFMNFQMGWMKSESGRRNPNAAAEKEVLMAKRDYYREQLRLLRGSHRDKNS